MPPKALATYRLTRTSAAPGLLLGLALILGVVGGFGLVPAAPPFLRDYHWPAMIACAVASLLSVVIRRRGDRQLSLVQDGEECRLEIDGQTALILPVVASGMQRWVRLRGGLGIYNVHLKLVDGRGRALFLRAVRGGLSGAEPDWFDRFTAGDVTIPSPEYDVFESGALAAIRAHVETLGHRRRV